MNINERIEELNTNLVLQETKIYLCLDDIKLNFLKMDNQSLSDFRKFEENKKSNLYLENKVKELEVKIENMKNLLS